MLNRAPAQQPRIYHETGVEDNPLAKTLSPEAFAQYLINKMCALLEDDPVPEIIACDDIQDLDFWL